MTVYQINPLSDPRWERLSLWHPRASVFHTPAWLGALRRTYSFEPLALTTSPPGRELANGIVFARIKSWLTGNRVVSLPFSDHCEPLLDDPDELGWLLSRLIDDHMPGGWKYIEIRPMNSRREMSKGFAETKECWLHNVDLRRPADILFRSLHTNIQRNIKRAEGQFLRYHSGRSKALLQDFYGLLILTRRRHYLPPQPFSWFRSLLACMGERANISVAYKGHVPVAGILTLRHNDVLTYKYGCFDYGYRQFGGMSSLLWRAIQAAQQNGILEFDLGRSDCEDTGLITFKDRWASVRSPLTYWRCGTRRFDGAAAGRPLQFGRRILAQMPDKVLSVAGAVLYRHAG